MNQNVKKDITKAVDELVSERRNTRKIVAALIAGALINRSNVYSRVSEENKAEVKAWVDWIMEI